MATLKNQQQLDMERALKSIPDMPDDWQDMIGNELEKEMMS